MSKSSQQKSNRRVVGWLSLWVLGMFGFGYALVPLYDIFCEITGLKVHPGEATTVTYAAHSLTDSRSAGQAVPSVSPARAARHFRKTECFCFTRQELAPRESKVMPVTFVVDPALPEEVKTITLSYAVYPAKNIVPANS